METEGVLDAKLRKRKSTKAVFDPLNPGGDDNDSPAQKRRGTVSAATGSGKAYPSPGEVLRRNAAIRASGGDPIANTGTCTARPVLRAI